MLSQAYLTSRRLLVGLRADLEHHLPLLRPVHAFLIFICIAGFLGYRFRRRKSSLRVYNPRKWWELTTMRSRREFDANAPNWIEAWFSQNNKPLRFIVDSGYCTILPSSMADEFRKMKEICMYTFLGTVSSFSLA